MSNSENNNSSLTLSTSPKGVGDLPALFLDRNKHREVPQNRTISTMQELLKHIPTVIQERKNKCIEPGAPDDPVIQLLSQTTLPNDEWNKFAFFDTEKPYTRNLVSTDYSSYTLLLLCWNPQEESPIHDHPCDGCWVKVLQGTVQECRYDAHIHCTSTENFEENQISYVTDNIGYHKIGNPTDRFAVTLHVYAPPIDECRVWLQEDCTKSQLSVPLHYSEYGKRV